MELIMEVMKIFSLLAPESYGELLAIPILVGSIAAVAFGARMSGLSILRRSVSYASVGFIVGIWYESSQEMQFLVQPEPWSVMFLFILWLMIVAIFYVFTSTRAFLKKQK